jgi:hypothetical protein
MSSLIDIEQIFPHLAVAGYDWTSECTIQYNCVAWAAGDSTQRWDVDDDPLSYWPPTLPRTWELNTFISMFSQLGYVRCANGDYDTTFEKIAIYMENGQPKHVARQLEDGRWTSKLGDLDDITHTLDGLVGLQYGSPEIYMRRRASASPPLP